MNYMCPVSRFAWHDIGKINVLAIIKPISAGSIITKPEHQRSAPALVFGMVGMCLSFVSTVAYINELDEN